MNRFLRGLGALAAAAAAQALSRYLPVVSGFFDFFLIVAVYYAMTLRQVGGMFVGAGCGLVQDTLVGTIVGLHAFSKALLGYSIGVLGTRVLLHHALARLLVLAVATLLEAVIVFVLHLVLGLPADLPAGHELLGSMVGNVVLGGAIFAVLDRRRAMRVR